MPAAALVLLDTSYVASQYTCIYIHCTQVLVQCNKARSTVVVLLLGIISFVYSHIRKFVYIARSFKLTLYNFKVHHPRVILCMQKRERC